MNIFSKKQLFIQFISLFIAVSIIFFLFIFPAIKNTVINYNFNKLKINSEIKFQVPSPSYEQISDLKNYESIKDVFPYYDVFSDIYFSNNKEIMNSYILLIKNELFETFPFTRSNLRINYENLNRDDVGLVDYNIAKQYNLKIGDQVSFEIASFKIKLDIVGIIYNPIDYLHIQQDEIGLIVASLSEKTLNKIMKQVNKKFNYSGAYISVSSYEKTKYYLKNYKPLGRIKPASLFESKTDYNAYLDYFYSNSYESEIRDLSYINKLPHNNVFKFLIAFLCLTICYVFSIFFLLFSYKVKNRIKYQIQNGISLKYLRQKILLPLTINLIIIILILLFYEYIAISLQPFFAPLFIFSPMFFITILVYFAFNIFVLKFLVSLITRLR